MAGRILPASWPQPPKPKRRRFKPIPLWRSGDKVRWRDYTGTILRDTIDGQVEVLIGTRTYRLPKAELRPG